VVSGPCVVGTRNKLIYPSSHPPTTPQPWRVSIMPRSPPVDREFLAGGETVSASDDFNGRVAALYGL
jgi:hypothetical protein